MNRYELKALFFILLVISSSYSISDLYKYTFLNHNNIKIDVEITQTLDIGVVVAGDQVLFNANMTISVFSGDIYENISIQEIVKIISENINNFQLIDNYAEASASPTQVFSIIEGYTSTLGSDSGIALRLERTEHEIPHYCCLVQDCSYSIGNSNSGYLSLHMDKHEEFSSGLNLMLTSQKVICPLCSMKIHSRKHLLKHLRDKHKNYKVSIRNNYQTE